MVSHLCRSGLGRDLVLAVLERGDKVIATARAGSLHKLEDLKEKGADVLELDVTSPVDTLKQQAENAVAIHSRIDVLVNNAGKISMTRSEIKLSNAIDTLKATV